MPDVSFQCSIQRLLCHSRSEDPKDYLFVIITRMEGCNQFRKHMLYVSSFVILLSNSAQRFDHYSLLHI